MKESFHHVHVQFHVANNVTRKKYSLLSTVLVASNSPTIDADTNLSYIPANTALPLPPFYFEFFSSFNFQPNGGVSAP